MSARSLFYWLACGSFAVMAAHAAEPGSLEGPFESAATTLTFSPLPVPEPGRAVLLFAGIMAMAFTYRRVWLNWKRGV